jgi:UDP-glucuronate decarboxylase
MNPKRNKSNSTRNLVSGGAGFLGSHLIDKLMENNEKVICLDNYFTGEKSNVEKWINHPNFEIIRHDVTESIQLEVDKIWHLACPASPVHYQSNPIKTAKTIFLGTYNLLGLARRVKADFLLASTSEIYGDPEVHPQPESYKGSVNTIGLRSCYDEGKRIAETLCADYKRMHGLNIKIMRIFNTYGPRMRHDDGRVVSNFIFQALQGNPLTIYGNGSQTRSFCYVDDLIEGMISLMNSDLNTPVNIGNPEEFTILELANKIKKIINPDLNLIFKSLPEDDPLQRKPDITKAKAHLGWQPKINLNTGINYTIDWFRKTYFE